MHLPGRFVANLAQRFQEALPVLVIPEDRLLPVAPVHDVVDRPRALDAQFPGQASRPFTHSAPRR
ncbi:MAG: hypothetical protein ABSH34_12450 [Verrucomicrobiota bacterium]